MIGVGFTEDRSTGEDYPLIERGVKGMMTNYLEFVDTA